MLLFSKMMSGLWPHVPSVASLAKKFVEDVPNKDIMPKELKNKYFTDGRYVKARNASPPRNSKMGATNASIGPGSPMKAMAMAA